MKAPTKQRAAPRMGGRWTEPTIPEVEEARDWKWPRSVRKTVPRMLNDAQIDGMYKGTVLPIWAYDWALDPNGCRPEVMEHAMADFGLPRVGTRPGPRPKTQGRFLWQEHLEQACRFIVDGHQYFEQVAEARQDGSPSVNDGWVNHLRKLFPIASGSIQKIQPARDGGLEYIRVPALNQVDETRPGTVDVPIEALLAYVWDRGAANWRGRSMIRPLYRPFRLKDETVRTGAINISRAGGVPYVEAAEGTTPAQMRELHELASSFRIGETAGAALPHGAALKFAQAAGGDASVAFVKLQNEEMARAWLMMLLQVGQTDSGSRSTAETFVDYLALLQHAIAGKIAETFSRYMIEDWLEWTYGPEEEFAPLLVFKDASSDPADELKGAIDDALVEGALPADSQAAAALGVVPGTRPRSARAGKPAAAAEPAVGHRERTEIEAAAAVDFEAMDKTHTSALEDLVKAWGAVRAEQIAELAGLIEAAGGDVVALAQIQATSAGTDLLLEHLRTVTAQGIDGALAEAKAQGVTIATPDIDGVMESLEIRADATATLMARSLSEAAARKAIGISGGSLTPTQVAEQVTEHLEGLTDAYLTDQFGGLLTQGQNTGRRTVMADAPAVKAVYASELLDSNTCEACADLDGKQYDDLAAAEADYPTGGAAACLGGPRCRGTLVAIYEDEQEASVE